MKPGAGFTPRLRGAVAKCAWLAAGFAVAASVAPSPATATARPAQDTSGVAAPPADPIAAARGAALRVYVMTMGPGDAVWEKFGHNAIWVHDPERGVDPAYNYGIFSFDQPGFLGRLLRGNMLYTMAPFDAGQTVAHYASWDRAVWAQELNLTPAQKLELYQFLEWNARPENADYAYDYFRDNCSTRVRDALDRALGGLLRTALDTVTTGSTYRSESLRLTQDAVTVSTGLALALGPDVDRPLSAWEESFVPMRLSDHLASVRVPAAPGLASVDGDDAPLVIATLPLFAAERAPPPPEAPRRGAFYLLTGLALAALPAAARLATSRRGAAALAGLAALVSIVIGVFGTIIALLWLTTDHTDTYRNANLLLANPLSLVLGIALVTTLLRRGSPGVRTASLAMAVAALAALGALVSPLVVQQNGWIVALLLPFHLALTWAVYPAWQGRSSPAKDAQPTARGAATPRGARK